MTLRAWIIALAIANIALAAFGWYSDHGGRVSGAAMGELQPERIRLLAPKDAIAQGVGQPPRPCIEWGDFSVADAARAERMLEPALAGVAVESRRAEGSPASFWVYIPPQPSRRDAERVIEELKGMGVTDYYLVQDDARFLNGISLGLFSSESAANTRRAQLVKLGMTDVLIQARDGPAARTYLRMREVPTSLGRRLVAFLAEFPGTELQDCR